MTWSFFGPAAMILTAFGIVTRGDGWLTALDVVFAIVVGWMLLGRWYDQRRTSTATTAVSGEMFRRYVALLLSIAAGVWLVANVVGNHLLA